MRKITLELSEEEYRYVIRFLEKLRSEEQSKKRKSRWIRKDGFLIDPISGKRFDILLNRFVD